MTKEVSTLTWQSASQVTCRPTKALNWGALESGSVSWKVRKIWMIFQGPTLTTKQEDTTNSKSATRRLNCVLESRTRTCQIPAGRQCRTWLRKKTERRGKLKLASDPKSWEGKIGVLMHKPSREGTVHTVSVYCTRCMYSTQST